MAELIFKVLPDEDVHKVVMLGAGEKGTYHVTMAKLRAAAWRCMVAFRQMGLTRGDTVCCARIPNTCEVKLTVAFLALACMGVRVFLPMFTEVDNLEEWLVITECKLVVIDSFEACVQNIDTNTRLHEALLALLRKMAIPAVCITKELGVDEVLLADTFPIVAADDALVQECVAGTRLEDDFAIFTTSGSSGKSKLVVHSQAAFILKEQTVLDTGSGEKMDGEERRMIFLLTHTQSIFLVLGQLFFRQLILIIHPEWMQSRPESFTQLLLAAKLTHICCGTGLWHILRELCRRYAHLKVAFCKYLRRCEVAGNAFTPQEEASWRHFFNVPFANAYGSTETLRTSGSHYEGPYGAAPTLIGNLYPRVQMALKPIPDNDPEAEPLYELYVKTPFIMRGYLVGKGQLVPPGEWYFIGDVVTKSESAEGVVSLNYSGRRNSDFFKSSMGVKVQRIKIINMFKQVQQVGGLIQHLECFPMQERGSLAGLIFFNPEHPLVNALGLDRGAVVKDKRLIREAKGSILRYNDILFESLDSVTLMSYEVAQFVCVVGPPPKTTSKGLVTRQLVAAAHAELIQNTLTIKWKKLPELKRVKIDFTASDYSRYSIPQRGPMMKALKLDKQFVAGRGDTLLMRSFDDQQDNIPDLPVIDFVGGYGCNLLGHSQPEILAAAKTLLDGDGELPILDQFSNKRSRGLLCKELCAAVSAHTGTDYICKLATSGSEAVEMALAHALLEFRKNVKKLISYVRACGVLRLTSAQVEDCIRDIQQATMEAPKYVLTLTRSYHGKSLGARALIAKRKQIRPYKSALNVFALPVDTDAWDPAALAALIAQHSVTVAVPSLRRDIVTPFGAASQGTLTIPLVVGSIAEPIQGEGGIRVVPLPLLQHLAALPFPLILDEIQSGLGRAGTFLASAGVVGDYYTLGKSLGGGVVKISACLIKRTRYRLKFDKHFSSTYANDALSSHVARTVLRLLHERKASEVAAERGAHLLQALEALRARHPQQIRAIAGKGLMVGVEINTDSFYQTCAVLRGLVKYEQLGYLLAGYLLAQHRVRVLPTLSAPNTLRLEPSIGISDAQIDALVAGLEALCQLLAASNTAALFAHTFVKEARLGQVELEPLHDIPIPPYFNGMDTPAPGAVRVGFLAHFVYPDRELVTVEPSFRDINYSARKLVINHVMALNRFKPFDMFAKNLFGGRVWFYHQMVLADAFALEDIHRDDNRRRLLEQMHRALKRFAEAGCRYVVLGGFTSIVTLNGLALTPPPGLTLSTGNCTTVASSCRILLQFCKTHRVKMETLAIVGATGNIGSAVTYLMLEKRIFGKIILISRSIERLSAMRDAHLALLNSSHPQAPMATEIVLTLDMNACQEADVILSVAATNTPIIFPKQLHPTKPVVVSDISVPNALSNDARNLPNVLMVPFSGCLRVPEEPDFSISSHTANGEAFACCSEALILGLLGPERTQGFQLIGDIDLPTADRLDQAAEEFGFYQEWAAKPLVTGSSFKRK